MRVYDRMQAAFPGGQIPATVAVTGPDVTTPQLQAAIRDLERQAVATGTMNAPADVTVSADHRVASVHLPMKGDGTDSLSVRAVDALRDDVVPRDRRAASTAPRPSSRAWPRRRRTGTA